MSSKAGWRKKAITPETQPILTTPLTWMVWLWTTKSWPWNSFHICMECSDLGLQMHNLARCQAGWCECWFALPCLQVPGWFLCTVSGSRSALQQGCRHRGPGEGKSPKADTEPWSPLAGGTCSQETDTSNYSLTQTGHIEPRLSVVWALYVIWHFPRLMQFSPRHSCSCCPPL